VDLIIFQDFPDNFEGLAFVVLARDLLLNSRNIHKLLALKKYPFFNDFRDFTGESDVFLHVSRLLLELGQRVKGPLHVFQALDLYRVFSVVRHLIYCRFDVGGQFAEVRKHIFGKKRVLLPDDKLPIFDLLLCELLVDFLQGDQVVLNAN